MNLRAVRAFFIATLALNIAVVSLAMLDYFFAESKFFPALLVVGGMLVILTAAVMIVLSSVETVTVTEAAVEPEPEMVRVRPARPVPETVVTPMVVGLTSEEAPSAPFVFNGYTLYSNMMQLKGGKEQPFYFFAKKTPKAGSAIAKPAGYHVGVNEDTGLPFLKKGVGADGEDLTPDHESAPRPQCAALTEEGHQCRNSSRHASKYCASHFGYQPPVMSKAEAARMDTMARVRDAPDTLPAIRKH